jgi:hypothetical protein
MLAYLAPGTLQKILHTLCVDAQDFGIDCNGRPLPEG